MTGPAPVATKGKATMREGKEEEEEEEDGGGDGGQSGESGRVAIQFDKGDFDTFILTKKSAGNFYLPQHSSSWQQQQQQPLFARQQEQPHLYRQRPLFEQQSNDVVQKYRHDLYVHHQLPDEYYETIFRQLIDNWNKRNGEDNDTEPNQKNIISDGSRTDNHHNIINDNDNHNNVDDNTDRKATPDASIGEPQGADEAVLLEDNNNNMDPEKENAKYDDVMKLHDTLSVIVMALF